MNKPKPKKIQSNFLNAKRKLTKEELRKQISIQVNAIAKKKRKQIKNWKDTGKKPKYPNEVFPLEYFPQTPRIIYRETSIGQVGPVWLARINLYGKELLVEPTMAEITNLHRPKKRIFVRTPEGNEVKINQTIQKEILKILEKMDKDRAK